MGALRVFDVLDQDLRFGLRALRRAPGFALVAVLSLGLGIGANTAIFGVIHALMLRKLPVPNPEQLVQLTGAVERGNLFPRAEYLAFRDAPGISFATFFLSRVDGAELKGAALRPNVEMADGRFFHVLGLAPAAGRLLTEQDESEAAPVAVASYRFAQRYFGTAQAAVGERILLHGHSFTIVGVTPAGYRGLVLTFPFDLTVPRTTTALLATPRGPAPPEVTWVVGRLGGEPSAVAAAVKRAYANCCALGQLAPPGHLPGEQRVDLAGISRGIAFSKGGDFRSLYSRMLFALMGGVAVLLLISCSNVGNLLLARATVRSRELAVRLSLGASRRRVVRQLLVESGLLAGLGATLGVAAAVWGTAFLARHLPSNLRALEPFIAVEPNRVILGFSLGVAVFCTLLVGVLPALRATRVDPVIGLATGRAAVRGGRSRLDRAIVAAQVGLALVLVSSAGLLMTTFRNLRSGADGFEPRGLFFADFDFRSMPETDSAGVLLVAERVAERLREVPGVKRAVIGSLVPLVYGGGPSRVVQAQGLEEREVVYVRANPGFFDAVGIRLTAGRDFASGDRGGASGVAIVSRGLAERYFPGRNPIGASLRLSQSAGAMQIVGVAEDTKYFDLRSPAPLTLYQPWAASTEGFLIVVRTDGKMNAAAGIDAVRSASAGALPNVQARRVDAMEYMLDYHAGRERSLALIGVLFGAVAVGLAAIGLYGVMAFQVAARSGEIGIRMALGANGRRVVRMVLQQTFGVIAIGIVVGVPLALVAAKALASLLYGTSPWNATPLASAALVLIGVGTAASVLPARRASRVDPLIALRAE